jgi:hypothetical protein
VSFYSPDQLGLRKARDLFHEMLSRPSQEHEWQSLFTRYPHILSSALPLRIGPRDILPLGRPGQSEPDFIFYQRATESVSACGVIELKRPETRILVSPRRRQIILSRAAATAVRQAQIYAAHHIMLPDEVLFLGNLRYLFVIMGLTKEIAKGIARDALCGLLPPNCMIIPYDEVLRRFEQGMPQQVMVLVPMRSRGTLVPVASRDRLVPAEYPRRKEPLSELPRSLGTSGFFTLVELVLSDLAVDTEHSSLPYKLDRNSSREWRLDVGHASYVLTSSNKYREDTSDAEEPSWDNSEFRLHAADSTPKWLLLFRCWTEDSNYKDDYYGLWHPSSRGAAALFEEDMIARALFEGVRRKE